MKQIILKNQAIWTDWDETFLKKRFFVEKHSSVYVDNILSQERFNKFLM